jgi:two-component system response regulator ArlR
MRTTSKPKRVLVVEDDRKTAELVRLYLERAGYSVDVAHDGCAGLEKARQEEFDLIILDIMLPGMDGLSVCRKVRLESDVPVIMLTA